MSMAAESLAAMTVAEYEEWLEMVAPRYTQVECRQGRGMVTVYQGGCEVDPFNEPRFGDMCKCKNELRCEAEDNEFNFFADVVE